MMIVDVGARSVAVLVMKSAVLVTVMVVVEESGARLSRTGDAAAMRALRSEILWARSRGTRRAAGVSRRRREDASKVPVRSSSATILESLEGREVGNQVKVGSWRGWVEVLQVFVVVFVVTMGRNS